MAFFRETPEELKKQLEELEKQYEGHRRPQNEALENALDFLKNLLRQIDASSAVAASVFYDPSTRHYQEHLAPKIEEASPAARFIGNLIGTLVLVWTGGQMLGQAGRAAMMFPQIASRVPQVSPFTAELVRDLALGPTVEALRAALGHEVTAEDVLRSTVTIGGAGLAATPVRRALQGASPWLARPAIGAAATAGAAAGAAPFEEGTLPERLAAVAPEALGTGLAMGLLYPLGQTAPQTVRKAVEEAVEEAVEQAAPQLRRLTRFELTRMPVEEQRRIASMTDEQLREAGIELAEKAREYLQFRFDPKYAELISSWERAGVPNEVISNAIARTDPTSLARRQQRLRRTGMLEIPMPQRRGWVRMPAERANYEVAQRAYINAGRPPSMITLRETLPDPIQRPPEALARLTPEPPRSTALEQPMAPPQQPLTPSGSVSSISVTSPVRSVEDVMPGDRVFSQRLGKSVEVVRTNVKTITVKDADGKTYRLPPSDLLREQAVRREEVVAPARPLIRRPPVEQEPVRLDPVQAERVMQQPEAIVADMVVNDRFEGLFAPLGDVMGDASSLPKEEMRLLPRNLREQLEGIDEHIKALNGQAMRLLRRHKAKAPSDLPPQAQEKFMQIVDQLNEMNRRRNELKPAVIGALESRGNLSEALARRIQNERDAGFVVFQRPPEPVETTPATRVAQEAAQPTQTVQETAQAAQQAAAAVEAPATQPSPMERYQQFISTPQAGETPVTAGDIAGRVRPEELPLTQVGRSAFHRELDQIVGFEWKKSVEGVKDVARTFRTIGWRHRDLLEVPQDAMQAMRASTPTWYAKLFGLARDVFGEDIVKPVRDAHYKYASFVHLYMNKLEDILKPYLRNPAARERIARYLEGETVEGLTKQEIQAAERLRKEFFGADPNSGLFKEFGLDPNRFLTDYLPRLRKGEDLSKILPAEVYQEVKFFAEFERTAKVFENREYDVLKLAMAYLRSGAKRKFFKPVQDVIDPLLSDMDPNRKRLFDMWWGVLMGRPIADEIMINTMIERLAGPLYRALRKQFPDRPAQELSHLLVEMTHLGTIGFNPFSAIKNLTQQLHVVGAVGPQYWLKAQRALRTQSGKELLNYNWVGQHRVYLQGLELQKRIMDRIFGPIPEWGFKMFEWADQQNVQTAYMAGLLKALDEGKSLRQAIEEGNALAAMTQFLYGIDSPTLFRTPVGRLVGVLHTYPVNFARMLEAYWSTGHRKEAVKTIAALVLGGYVLSETTGFNFRDIYPWRTLEGHPIYSFLVKKEFSIPIETAVAGVEALRARIVERDPRLVQEATDKFLEHAKQFIPGKAQYDRFARFIRRAMNEWQELDEQGAVRYTVSPGEAVRGIFGPTTEAEDRYNLYREYEETIIEAVDPEALTTTARAAQAVENFLWGDPAWRLGELQRKAVQLGLDPQEVHQNALRRVRSYYYGTGNLGFWPAVYRGNIQQAQRYAQVLRRLGVTAADVQRSGESRGLDPMLIWQGMRIFGPPYPVNVPTIPSTTGRFIPPIPGTGPGMGRPPVQFTERLPLPPIPRT